MSEGEKDQRDGIRCRSQIFLCLCPASDVVVIQDPALK